MKLKITIILSLSVFLLSFRSLHAQLTPEDAIKDIAENISIQMTPENPGPNTSVTINIESYATDLNQAGITWTSQGQVIQSGVGKKTVSFMTGDVGSTITIKISIKPIDGDLFTKTIVITPTSVDLMWQSLAYTPPFYKGRALMANQGSAVFLAVPKMFDSRGSLLDPKKLVYTWSKNGTVLGSLSGYGKNSLYVDNSLLGLPFTISVSVAASGNSTTANNSVYINPIEPKVIFYENNPLYGRLYNNALDNFTLLNKEITIIGSPFYFSTRDFGGAIQYNWSLNRKDVVGVNQNFITLRQETGGGESILGLTINNANKLIQTASKEVLIKFNNQSNI